MKISFGPDFGYFLWSLIIGFAMAFGYDFFRAGRRKNTANFIVISEDVIFVIAGAVAVMIMTYIVNNGVLRFYSIFSVALGFVIYRLIFKDRIVRIILFLWDKIKKSAQWIFKMVMLPVGGICKVLGKPVVFVVARIKVKSNKKTEKNL